MGSSHEYSKSVRGTISRPDELVAKEDAHVAHGARLKISLCQPGGRPDGGRRPGTPGLRERTTAPVPPWSPDPGPREDGQPALFPNARVRYAALRFAGNVLDASAMMGTRARHLPGGSL